MPAVSQEHRKKPPFANISHLCFPFLERCEMPVEATIVCTHVHPEGIDGALVQAMAVAILADQANGVILSWEFSF